MLVHRALLADWYIARAAEKSEPLDWVMTARHHLSSLELGAGVKLGDACNVVSAEADHILVRRLAHLAQVGSTVEAVSDNALYLATFVALARCARQHRAVKGALLDHVLRGEIREETGDAGSRQEGHVMAEWADDAVGDLLDALEAWQAERVEAGEDARRREGVVADAALGALQERACILLDV